MFIIILKLKKYYYVTVRISCCVELTCRWALNRELSTCVRDHIQLALLDTSGRSIYTHISTVIIHSVLPLVIEENILRGLF